MKNYKRLFSVRKWIYISFVFGLISIIGLYIITLSRTNAYLSSSIQIKEKFKENGLVVKSKIDNHDNKESVKKYFKNQQSNKLTNSGNGLDIKDNDNKLSDLGSNSKEVKQENELVITASGSSSSDKVDKLNNLDIDSKEVKQLDSSDIDEDKKE